MSIASMTEVAFQSRTDVGQATYFPKTFTQIAGGIEARHDVCRQRSDAHLEAINSDLAKLLLGFGVTAFVGQCVAYRYQDRSWAKQQEFDIRRRKLNDGQKSLEEISDLMSTRLFRMRRLLALLRGNDLGQVDAEWPSYVEITERRNAKLGIYQNKVRRLVTDSMGTLLNNHETDNTAIQDPKSIHGMIFVAGNELERLRACEERPNCKPRAEDIKELAGRLNQLDMATDSFVDGALSLFLNRATELEHVRP